jgi:Transcriptional regulators
MNIFSINIDNASTSKYNKKMEFDFSIQLIGRIRAQANKFILQEMEKLDLPNFVPSHGDILIALFEQDDRTMTEISKRIHRERSTTTTLVSKLVKLGFIGIRKNYKDIRYNIVYLTEKGKDLKPKFFDISKRMYAIEYKGIPEDERTFFVDLLKKILFNLENNE